MKISIVMPCFNELEYTKKTIDNLLETQKDIEYELIIINDGSSDGTKEWLDANKKSNWRIVHQENKWVTSSRNLWVEMAIADYVAIINNDVLMKEWCLTKLLSAFDREDIMIVCPRFTQKTEDYWDRIFYFVDHIAGFFYVINKKAKTELFPIDTRMRIFGNDNRLYFKMLYMWYKLKVVKDVIVHHFKSITVSKMPNVDAPIFFQIMKEEWWYVRPTYECDIEPKEDLLFWL